MLTFRLQIRKKTANKLSRRIHAKMYQFREISFLLVDSQVLPLVVKIFNADIWTVDFEE